MAFNREKVISSAEKYVSKNKIEAGIREYRKVLAQNPNDANTLNRVGDLYARIERIDEAVRLFAQIAEQYTTDGFFVKAIAIYKKIIKLDPTSLQVYERLAELYHKQGLLNEARTQYQVLADYYQKHDNAASAISIFQRMAAMEPDNPTFRLKLAELYSSQRLIEKAQREYQILAELMVEEGTAEEIAQVYYKAFAVNNAGDLDFVRRAFETLKVKDLAIAESVLDRAAELNPQAAELRYTLLAPPAPAPPEPALPDQNSAELGAQPGDQEVFAPGSGADFLSASETGDDGAFTIDLESDPAADSFDFTSDEDLAGAPAEEEAGVFTLDLDDDEVPDSLVTPPADLSPAQEMGADAAGDDEFEFVIEGFDGSEGGADEEDGADEEETIAAQPAASRPSLAQVPAESVEIDWSLDEIALDESPSGALEAGSAEISEVDLLDTADAPAAEVEAFAVADDLIEIAPGAIEPEALEPDTFEIAFDDISPMGEELAVEVEPEEVEVEAAADLAAVEGVVPEPPTRPPALQPEPQIEWSTLVDSESGDGALSEVELPEIDLTPPALEVPEASAEATERSAEPEVAEPAEEAQEVAEPAEEAQEVTEPAEEAEAAAESAEEAQEAAPPIDEIEPLAPGGISPAVQRREDDLLAEAEVFFKYGLQDRSRDRLKELLDVNPNHIAGMVLMTDIELKEGRRDEVIAQANEIARLAPEYDEQGQWPDLRERLVEAGYVFEGGRFTAAPKPTELASDNRIAQLLEDLDTDEIRTMAAGAQGKKISLIDELGLDGLDEFDEDDEVTAAAAVDAEGVSADGGDAEAAHLLDETGMSWLDDAPEGEQPAAAAAPEALFDEEDDFFDLAAELQRELGEDELQEVETGMPQEQSLEEIIDGFKKGVAENLSAEDYETHFNLGIAYREMGLLDEAIGEFQLASKDERYLVDCSSLLGMCFLEKGLPDLALKWYRRGLEAPGIRDEVTIGLLYDMGSAYLSLGDNTAASKMFHEVHSLNSDYRDVSAKLEELGQG